MKLLIVSAAPLVFKNECFYAYAPYLKELELWSKNSDEIIFCCPIWNEDNGLLISEINFPFSVIPLIDFDLTSFKNILFSINAVFKNIFFITKAYHSADHIHIRCPGNVGLLGCIVQIFFPNKKKSVKYAGNWDPNSKQPYSYKIQKWILNSTFLSRNIQVLVYGDWKGMSRNIKPFFTATYSEKDKINILPRVILGEIKFLFVGTLVDGKNPLYAVKIVELLSKSGLSVKLDLLGEGNQRQEISEYLSENKIEDLVCLKGNQDFETVKLFFQENHFVILPSKSEGWPKVIAEAMFWGCIPIATPVSCVPYMLDNGNRGILLEQILEIDVKAIMQLISNSLEYKTKAYNAISWSRKFTVEEFEIQINNVLKV